MQKNEPETAIQVVRDFDPGAGAVVLEEEIRESVINTVGAALGEHCPVLCPSHSLPILAMFWHVDLHPI